MGYSGRYEGYQAGLWRPGSTIDFLEQTNDSREKELDEHRQELIELRDKNMALRYQLEDLKNRSSCSYILIIGVPLQAASGKLEDYVTCLFLHVPLELADQDIILD
ncbi:hypothetical protein NDU88_005099 [Pleurodeles waltl]|uniref:Uncharacterized protein n=1 Tax=Pleurodeles waltl TaxID=8319 RepID=A0AAV7WU92_PLEWA|nr:hypothetical protein NDU88_005099 [Pleurodeles waltl]